VTAGLIVAAITAIATWFVARMWQQRKIDAAPYLYVKELDVLIKRAVREGENLAIINARAIVGVRNSRRSSLISISTLLNSEIDRLSSDIGDAITALQTVTEKPRAEIDPSEVYQTIQVLERTWPGKRTQIVVEIRKVLAELNLEARIIDRPESGESGGASAQGPGPSGPSDSSGSSGSSASRNQPNQNRTPKESNAKPDSGTLSANRGDLSPNEMHMPVRYLGFGPYNDPPSDPPKHHQAGGSDT
jgi:hypothetical protein